MSLTVRAFFSDHVTTLSMLIDLSLLEIGSTGTFDGSMRAQLIVLTSFLVGVKDLTSLVSAREFGRI